MPWTHQTDDKVIHVVSVAVSTMKIWAAIWARKQFLKAACLKILPFWTPESAVCQVAVSTGMHTHTLHAPTHTHITPDNGSHQSGWQSRQTDYLSPCSRRGKPPNSMLSSLKAAKTVSKHPPLLLTHTNIILHNSADPDPTVHILLLAKGSVHVITTTWATLSFNVVFLRRAIPRCYSLDHLGDLFNVFRLLFHYHTKDN